MEGMSRDSILKRIALLWAEIEANEEENRFMEDEIERLNAQLKLNGEM